MSYFSFAQLIKKKLANERLDSVFLTHGVHFEDDVRDAVCSVLGEEAIEWGLVLHKDIPWLGASPDGIFPLSGRCLELKAPLKRDLVAGDPSGHLIPHHYFPQVQIQMQCCGCSETIFAEAKIGKGGITALNITVISRDDAWFKSILPQLESFRTELAAAKKAYKAPPPKPLKVQTIVEDLYEE